MLPLASKGLINGEIHVTAITGSTGAGQKTSEKHISVGETTIFQPIKYFPSA
jgi:N-acetyl-gamma-glutamylphosphate reductase